MKVNLDFFFPCTCVEDKLQSWPNNIPDKDFSFATENRLMLHYIFRVRDLSISAREGDQYNYFGHFKITFD